MSHSPTFAVSIPAGKPSLEGNLSLPENVSGIVLFAHGSGSSRFSPRNNFVARELYKAGIGSLLFDLLTAEEDSDYDTRFDIPLLTSRLVAATTWLWEESLTRQMKIGYFGASTGAAAALQAATKVAPPVSAIVSRGGRPDLAGNDFLSRVNAPTLLIVGGLDDVVIQLNRQAYAALSCEKELVIIPGATHLFEEPGTLEEVAKQATSWFKRHL
jgi:putative phosphoribosyl transferase